MVSFLLPQNVIRDVRQTNVSQTPMMKTFPSLMTNGEIASVDSQKTKDERTHDGDDVEYVVCV